MSEHLGDLAAAVVDGQLDDAARERLLAHAARCGRCRAELGAERAVKVALRGLQELHPPAELTERLFRLMPACGPGLAQPPRAAAGGGDGAWPPPPQPGCTQPRRLPAEATPPVRPVPSPGRRRRIAVAGGIAAGVAVAGLLSLGGRGPRPGGPLPVVNPSSARYVVEHADTTGQLPGVTDLPVLLPVTQQ